MNREIKFRAWDNIFNAMLSDVVVWDIDNECIAILDQPAQWVYGDKLDERMELNFEGSVPEWYCFTGGFNIMQYTGLKDKNGVEIYEGDICRILYTDWPSNTDPNIELEDYLISISHIGNIVYTAPSFEIELPDRYGDRSGMTLHYGTHGRIQVIGNIYQNPELLP